MRAKWLVSGLAAVLLAGCGGHAVREAAPASASTAPSQPLAVAVATPRDYAADNLNAVVWTQLAVEHDLIYREVYRAAQDQLLTALKDPTWDALPKAARHTPAAGLPPAVVLDIDETVLDNSPYQARLLRTGRAYDDATWAAWVREERAQPLPGALAYTQFAAAHGVAVIYLSNRAQDLNDATLANLRKLGFPVSGPDAFLGLGLTVPGCQSQGTDKACRRQLVASKYRVLAQVGDQLGDFVTPEVKTPNGRRSAVEPYLGWIGSRWFVLPNPTYGSWESATFGNDWKQSDEVRHQRKVEGLRVQ